MRTHVTTSETGRELNEKQLDQVVGAGLTQKIIPLPPPPPGPPVHLRLGF
jgi:hypothetical protein